MLKKLKSNMETITGTIDRIEEQTAVIRLADGQEILWPSNLLPEHCPVGTNITITLTPDTAQTTHTIARAKSLLDDILTSPSK
jgi:hypothetical protein